MLKLQLLAKPPVPPKPRRGRVRIHFDALAAREVAITGDFCNWSPTGRPLARGDDGVWRANFLLPAGRYEYRLRVDGAWADDPDCPERVPNPYGTENGVLRVGHACSCPPAEDCRRHPGRPCSHAGHHRPGKELARYRRALLALAARLDRTLAHDRRELLRLDEPDVAGGPRPPVRDEPDDGLREVEAGLVANESHLLAEVAAALNRIDAGVFGRCEGCGKGIARARLDALPYARQCIRCARAGRPAAG